MRLDDFIQAAREFSACAKRVALVLQQSPSTAKGRRPEDLVTALSLDIVNFTHGSPAAVACFERTDDQVLMEGIDFGAQTYRTLLDGIAVAGGESHVMPPGFDLGVLMKLRDIGRLFNKGVNRMEYSLHDRRNPVTVSFDPPKYDRIRQLIEEPAAQLQTIEGRLLMADFKETGMQLRIHPPLGAPVNCKFPAALSAEVEECIRQFVRVRGEMDYFPHGAPKTLNISDIEPIEAPTMDVAKEAGAEWSYDFTENLPAAEYARRQGVQPLVDFSALFGKGKAEDWDGFEERLEQWRAEQSSK